MRSTGESAGSVGDRPFADATADIKHVRICGSRLMFRALCMLYLPHPMTAEMKLPTRASGVP
jgi:hypothetical protein